MPYTTTAPRIWWEEHGSGSPVLLVMGKGFSSAMWHRAVPALAARHRVVLFDNRGIGRSGQVRAPFTVGDLAEDARAVLDAAGVEQAHVYGVSMGGVVAQELALRHPERVRSLVLGCTGAPDGTATRAARRTALRGLLPVRLLVKAFPRQVAASLYGSGATPEAVREDLAVLASTRSPGRVVQAQGAAIDAFESVTRLGAVGVPTLVLHGTGDVVVPWQKGAELAELVPGARLHLLDGAGHNFLTDATEEANRVVQDFLAAVEQGSARAAG